MRSQPLLTVIGLAAGCLTLAGSTPVPRLRTLFLSGSPAPSGLAFASFGRAALNSRGTACFLAGWDATNHRPEGLYLRRGEETVPIVRSGDPIPGGGGRFSFPIDYPDELTSFSLNDRDEVAFVTRQGLFLYEDGDLYPVARIGDKLPGTQGERWEEIYGVSLNDSGALAFVAATRSDSDGDRHEGVFLLDGAAPRIVQFVGDPAPGSDDELTSFSAVSLNNLGEIAMLARVGEDGLSAILLTSGNESRLIALQGEAAPGGTWADLGSVKLNDRSQIAFQGQVDDGAGVKFGEFLADAGQVLPVAIPGDGVEGPGEIRVGDFLGRPILDNAGNVAFLTELTDSPGRSALVIVVDGHRRVVAADDDAVSGISGSQLKRFTGLNQDSLHDGKLICGVQLSGGNHGTAVISCSNARSPAVVISDGVALPRGSAVSTVDGESMPRESQAVLRGRDDLLFTASAGGYGRALYHQGASGPELLTPLGKQADGSTLVSVVNFAARPGGKIAVLCASDEQGIDGAIRVIDAPRQPSSRILAATGQALPGGQGGVITWLGPPQIDGQGRVLFAARAADTDVNGALDGMYLVRAAADRLEVLAASGMAIPGGGSLGVGTVDGDSAPLVFRELQTDRDGDALFLSGYQDSGTGSRGSTGLFILSGGEFRAIALPGRQSPLPGGPTYTGFWAPRLSEDGTITFVATVSGAGQRQRFALFQVRGGQAAVLAVSGDRAPDTNQLRFRSLWDPAVGAMGNISLYATLETDAGVGREGAVFRADANRVTLALSAAVSSDADDGPRLRFDEAAAPSSLSLLDDGTSMIAGRLKGDDGASGLFLLER